MAAREPPRRPRRRWRAQPPGEVRVRRALLSVSEKRGIVDFARGLRELGVEIVSTGGTARALEEAGLAVRSIDDFTGFPEIMDGRVKTLHPRLYAGLLARRDEEEHLRAAAEQEIEQVDLVCVNLYPFEQTVARGDAGEAEVIENIDIGGPTMIRAAAKNSAFAAVVVEPEDYGRRARGAGRQRGQADARDPQRAGGQGVRLHGALRRRDLDLVRGAHLRGVPTALERRLREGQRPALRGEPPPARGLLRAARAPPPTCWRGSRQLHGKELSFNNLLDLSSARRAARGVRRAGVRDRQAQQPLRVRRRRVRPSRLRTGLRLRPPERLWRRDRGQPPRRRAFAEELAQQFIEVAAGPRLSTRMPWRRCRSRRTCACSSSPTGPLRSASVEAKAVIGGQLVQSRDVVSETREQMRVMSRARARRARSGRTCCSPGASAVTCAPTRS